MGDKRKTTYRLYPSRRQLATLEHFLLLHQRLYNAALEQRRWAYRVQRTSPSFSEQCKEVTALRAEDEAYADLNAQSLQVTLKRLDLAFQHFFRRVKRGETPGYPRFKALQRYPGWGYKTHGDGWRLHEGEDGKHGTIRLSGVGMVRLRGCVRTLGRPKTCEIIHKNGRWYASVTMDVEPKRRSAALQPVGLDWGVESFATLANGDGSSEVIENPRHLRQAQARLRGAQKDLSRKKKGSCNRKRAVLRVAGLHAKVANKRHNFLHQTSNRIVFKASHIATEKLSVRGMTASGGAYKRGLNREILCTSPSAFLSMLRYKAEEAGIGWTEVPTRKVKPSQTCSGCGEQRKKALSERWHACACGVSCSRDENAARVMLAWAVKNVSGPGTGLVSCGAGAELVLKHETPSIAA